MGPLRRNRSAGTAGEQPSDTSADRDVHAADTCEGTRVGAADLSDDRGGAQNDSSESAPVLERRANGSRRRIALRGVFAAVIALSTAAAVWFGISAQSLSDSPAARNAALVDVPATGGVAGQVGDGIRAAFSYDYTNPASTLQTARNVLIGNAVDQYNRLFTQVQTQAPAQKMVLTTTVRSAGVMELSADRARVLVFVDQQSVRMDSNQRNSGAAQLDVVAVRSGPQWKISEITVL